MSFLASVLATGAIALTFLSFWRHGAWWVRIWDFPRVQLVVLMGLAVLLRLAAGAPWTLADALLSACLAFALGLQVRAIAPFTRLWRRQVLRSSRQKGPQSLSLMAVNVLMDNREAARLIEVIGRFDPDIILAVETDEWWARQLEPALATSHPHKLACPLPNTYGMLLFSRLPFEDQEVNFLLKPDIPSMRAGLVLRSGEVVDLWGVHPEPPSPTEAPTSVPRDAELVLVAQAIQRRREQGPDRPVILLGDLNDVAWSRTTRSFLRLSGLVDPRVGRGFYNSFHAKLWPLRWPLDHLFHSPDFLLRHMRRLPAFGSDHFPILVELDHAPRAERHQAPDAPREDDEEQAQAVLEQARQEVSDSALDAPAGARFNQA